MKVKSESDIVNGSIGTLYFMPPEGLKSVNKEGYSGKKADIWSLGVTIYSFIYQRLPFFDLTYNGLITKVCEERYDNKPNLQ